jgi:hypothetical protein
MAAKSCAFKRFDDPFFFNAFSTAAVVQFAATKYAWHEQPTNLR